MNIENYPINRLQEKQEDYLGGRFSQQANIFCKNEIKYLRDNNLIKIVHENCLIMTPTNFWATLKRFDAYAKPMDDFRIRTRSGGILTVLSGLVMIILFASEFRDYLQPQMKEELFVDTSRTGKLKINVDVIFSRISCDFLGIDAMDISGEQHIDIEHNIYKRRLDLDGKPIEDAQKDVQIGAIAKIVNTANKTSEEIGTQNGTNEVGEGK